MRLLEFAGSSGVAWGREGEEREREGEGGRERERAQNFITQGLRFFGICLFLQPVLANLHANTYTTPLRTLTTIITMMKMTIMIYW